MVKYYLIHDDNGKVISYTCDKVENNCIEIDMNTYMACRFDIKIIDGSIVSLNDYGTVNKLKPSSSGTVCTRDNILIIAPDNYNDTICWEVKSYEFKYS